MTNSEMKKAIAAFMFKTQHDVSPREVAIEMGLDPTKSRHYEVLKTMAEAGDVIKLDIGRYVISDSGITQYGLRDSSKVTPSTLGKVTGEVVGDKSTVVKKSALVKTDTTIEKPVQPAPIVEESVLEQICDCENHSDNDEGGRIWCEGKENCRLPKFEPMEATNSDGTPFEYIAPTIEEKAQVWQILEEAGDKIIALQQSSTVENLDAKLNLLRNALPGVLNETYAVVLLQIADDLESK